MEPFSREPSCCASLASWAEASGVSHALRCGGHSGAGELTLLTPVLPPCLTITDYAQVTRYQDTKSQPRSERLVIGLGGGGEATFAVFAGAMVGSCKLIESSRSFISICLSVPTNNCTPALIVVSIDYINDSRAT